MHEATLYVPPEGCGSQHGGRAGAKLRAACIPAPQQASGKFWRPHSVRVTRLHRAFSSEPYDKGQERPTLEQLVEKLTRSMVQLTQAGRLPEQALKHVHRAIEAERRFPQQRGAHSCKAWKYTLSRSDLVRRRHRKASLGQLLTLPSPPRDRPPKRAQPPKKAVYIFLYTVPSEEGSACATSEEAFIRPPHRALYAQPPKRPSFALRRGLYIPSEQKHILRRRCPPKRVAARRQWSRICVSGQDRPHGKAALRRSYHAQAPGAEEYSFCPHFVPIFL